MLIRAWPHHHSIIGVTRRKAARTSAGCAPMADTFNRIAEYGKQIDFGKTADDYGRYRAGFPTNSTGDSRSLASDSSASACSIWEPAPDISAAASRARDAASRGWISHPR